MRSIILFCICMAVVITARGEEKKDASSNTSETCLQPDPRFYCVYDNKLYSEKSILIIGNFIMMCHYRNYGSAPNPLDRDDWLTWRKVRNKKD